MELAAIAALVGAGCVAIYAGVARMMRRAIQERQLETQQQLNALATTVRTLQARVVELGEMQTTAAQERAFSSPPATQNEGGELQAAEKPEVLAAITAAATAFLGKRARIRSVQSLPAAQEGAAAWAQQGRVFVQTSHNPRSRG
jgi:outer membrane murein-binding lipoprotein Lpp